MKKEQIYLDSHATTPVDQVVLSTMLPYFTEHYGNGNHKAGRKTTSAMEKARFQVSNLIGARPSEIVFTSGATEAINMALIGLAENNYTERNHIITQKSEHKAVLENVEVLKQRGYKVSILDVDSVGRIDLKQLENLISDKTLVVAIMLSNNEIGTVQSVEEIGKITQKYGSKFFCDITQGVGWHAIDVDKMNIDLASMSSHKIYGPRGVGALFMRRKGRKANISPILYGGGQERGFRPGTANLPGIVGFGKACELFQENQKEIYQHIKTLRDHLQNHIFNNIEGVKLNGCPENRHPGNLNIAIPNITGEELIGKLPNIMFSTGSACSSGSAKPSHVIAALHVEDNILKDSFRIGIGKHNTIAEIDYVGDRIVTLVNEISVNNLNQNKTFYS